MLHQHQEEFIKKAKKHLRDNSIAVTIVNRKSVKLGGFRVSGYYCSVDKVLKCATDYPDWFQVFVHEYCHFLQDMDKNYKVYPDNIWEDYDLWLSHKLELSSWKINSYTDKIRADEMDCERRVLKLNEKHNLGIDKKKYIQEANTYGALYTFVKRYRHWPGGVDSPLRMQDLIATMPTSFKRNWEVVPRKFEEIITERCFKQK
jgi:hypothetical protein